MALSAPTGEAPLRGEPEPAVVVPDAEAWASWGVDLAALGFAPAARPASAQVLVVPETVPAGVVDAARERWERMPPPRRLVRLPAPHLAGRRADEALGAPIPERRDDTDEANAAAGGSADDGSHEAAQRREHEPTGGHDHGNMMEVTGEPSADGLVMEALDFRLGPLAAGLPGGLVLDLSLDGDVVAACAPRPTLCQPADGRPPDPLAPAAWTVAIERAWELAAGQPTGARVALRRVAAVELERALSHLLWLRAFARVLGWGELGDRAHEAAAPLIGARAPDGQLVDVDAERLAIHALRQAHPRARRLKVLLAGSRRLASRTRGRARLEVREVQRRGVGGPIARACGLRVDARTEDPLYRRLGFRPHLRAEGDAEARTLLRCEEALRAVELAFVALRLAGDDRARGAAPGHASGPVTVESARGTLRVAPPGARTAPALSAAGAAATSALAGEAVLGMEWGSALSALASFDLSPWAVAG